MTVAESLAAAFRLVVMGLAAYRMTRLIVRDEIAEGPRVALVGWLERRAHPKLAYLIGCPWCAGAYVSAATVALVDVVASVPLPVLQGFALSAIVGRLSETDEDDG